jgi:hyperosmotically inducible periplasmic protein
MQMKTTIKIIALALIWSFALMSFAQNSTKLTDDQIVTNRVASKLAGHDRFHGVNVQVDDRIARLSGNVELYIDKADAGRKAEKVDGVSGVRNEIIVNGKNVSDAELQETLANKLRYDRLGYGIAFNNLAVKVTDGKATVSGQVRDYSDRNSAIAIVETTLGVLDVEDEIAVAPLSVFDDQLRINLARAIYGHPSLQKYAMDPQAPIRIVVENGRVQLYGATVNEMDKQVAYTQANSVPGVFGVTNHIVVAK